MATGVCAAVDTQCQLLASEKLAGKSMWLWRTFGATAKSPLGFWLFLLLLPPSIIDWEGPADLSGFGRDILGKQLNTVY